MERETKIFTREDLLGIQSSFVSQMLEHGIESLCCIPLTTRKGELGTLNLASREERAFAPQDVGFLQQVAAQVAVALDNARSYREIAQLTEKLASEKLYLEEEIRTELNFEEIVGESPALKRVLSQARTVAPSDATVLILGDTGTGKELIARAIHRMSSRKDRLLVKLNCAAIPLVCWRASSLAMRRALLPAPSARKSDVWNWRTREVCFWMKWEIFPWNCSRNCCASCRTRNSKGWAAPAPSRWTFA